MSHSISPHTETEPSHAVAAAGPIPVSEVPKKGQALHRKSRRGCVECKRRKVKCTEQKPSCRACLRNHVTCVYREPTARTPSSCISNRTDCSPQNEHAVASSSLSDLLHRHDPVSTEELQEYQQQPRSPTSELPLLYQWLMSTSKTFARSQAAENCWQHIFPQLGFAHDFVMNAIFGIAAIHLAYLCPANKDHHLRMAMRYNAISVRGICDHINRLDGEVADAVFAAAAMNIPYVFCAFGRLNNPCGNDASITVRARRVLGADWIPMVRGVGAVLEPVYDQVRTGRLAQMLELPFWDVVDPDTACVPGDENFRNLASAWAGDNDAELYSKELQSLRKCHTYMRRFMDPDQEAATTTSSNDLSSGPIMWLLCCSEDFLRRLHQRKPEALLLFAYFGTLLHMLDNNWFMEGWGKDIVDVVGDLLGDAWIEWMSWPRTFVETSNVT